MFFKLYIFLFLFLRLFKITYLYDRANTQPNNIINNSGITIISHLPWKPRIIQFIKSGSRNRESFSGAEDSSPPNRCFDYSKDLSFWPQNKTYFPSPLDSTWFSASESWLFVYLHHQLDHIMPVKPLHLIMIVCPLATQGGDVLMSISFPTPLNFEKW